MPRGCGYRLDEQVRERKYHLERCNDVQYIGIQLINHHILSPNLLYASIDDSVDNLSSQLLWFAVVWKPWVNPGSTFFDPPQSLALFFGSIIQNQGTQKRCAHQYSTNPHIAQPVSALPPPSAQIM